MGKTRCNSIALAQVSGHSGDNKMMGWFES